jgi:hypothetical protein
LYNWFYTFQLFLIFISIFFYKYFIFLLLKK